MIDRQLCRMRHGTRDAHQRTTEFWLLDVPIQRPQRALSRERLLDRVWGKDVHAERRTVDVHVGRMRKALDKRGEGDPIRTVRASGDEPDET